MNTHLANSPRRSNLGSLATRTDLHADPFVELRSLQQVDLLHLVVRMREMDRLEIASLMPNQATGEALSRAVQSSVRTRTGLWKGELVACWGIVPRSQGSTEGAPWLLATDLIEDPEVRRAFIRHGTFEISRLTRGFRYLWNVVHRDNGAARRWLRFMGFEFRDPQEYMFSGEPFVRFEMEML